MGESIRYDDTRTLDTGSAATGPVAVSKDNPLPVSGFEGLEVFAVTLSLDTNAYADGDVMADTQALTNAVRDSGGKAILHSIHVLDKDDVGQTFDILILNANNSLGTENSAPTITDGNAEAIRAAGGPANDLRINSTDYIDLGGCKVATKTGIGAVIDAASGSRDLYIGTIIRGAGTYSASGVRILLGFLPG